MKNTDRTVAFLLQSAEMLICFLLFQQIVICEVVDAHGVTNIVQCFGGGVQYLHSYVPKHLAVQWLLNSYEECYKYYKHLKEKSKRKKKWNTCSFRQKQVS